MILDPEKFFNNSETHKRFFQSNARDILFAGSRGSGKSFSVADKIILTSLIEESKGKKLKNVVLRTSFTDLKDSCVATYRERLNTMKIPHTYLDSIPFTITLPGGSKIIFRSISNDAHVDSIKSMTDINFLHIEEATSLEEQWYLTARAIVRGPKDQIRQRILTCNPKSKNHWIYKNFIQNPMPLSEYIFTRTEDNTFLAESDIQDLKNLQYTNPYRYKIDYLGQWSSLEGLIYTNWNIVDKVPFAPSDEWYGLDFGFNDPTSLVKISKCDNELYLSQVIHRKELQPTQLKNLMRNLIPMNSYIYADCARPELISELFAYGFKNIRKSKKGVNSIQEGINYVRDFKLHILRDSVDLIKEIETYSYRTTKDGIATEDPIDKDNHMMDAMRYAIHDHLKIHKPSSYSISGNKIDLDAWGGRTLKGVWYPPESLATMGVV
jgi:phage terminase large subunit